MDHIKQQLEELYGRDADRQSVRYGILKECFYKAFGMDADFFISVPGRSELGGNHTDHQNGCVLAAAVNLDTIAAVCKTPDNIIRIHSEGYEPFEVDLASLAPLRNEAGGSRAIVRGIAARMLACGNHIGGFCAAVSSNVLRGSGISSSASFEVTVGSILNVLYNANAILPAEIARMGQFAENEYFGKPSGLMDQMACALGGVSLIDFENPALPGFSSIPFDLKAHGYALCITDTGGSHADLTEEYVSITREMGAVARALGQERLRGCEGADFIACLPALRKELGDRAMLRAIHFFCENKRPHLMAQALLAGNFNQFLSLVIQSGHSSYEYLQNVSVSGRPEEQPIGIALALSQEMLQGRGAWRVHGGGFAGTIQAYVPFDLLEAYKNTMQAVFGSGCCHVLAFRSRGPVHFNA